jgi:hypothetical protein
MPGSTSRFPHGFLSAQPNPMSQAEHLSVEAPSQREAKLPEPARRRGRTLNPVRKLTCKQVILQYVSDYLDANLSADDVLDLERHLETCVPCRAYVNTYASTHDLVRRTGQATMSREMKAHLRDFLLARLSNENGQHGRS